MGTADWGRCIYDVALAIIELQKSGVNKQGIHQFLFSYYANSPMKANELIGVRHYIALRWAQLAQFWSWRLVYSTHSDEEYRETEASLVEISEALTQALKETNR